MTHIAKHLINSYKTHLQDYFDSDKWEQVYRKNIPNVAHDEPWLTLIAIYSIFGNQKQNNSSNRLSAINNIIAASGLRSNLVLTTVNELAVEEKLPEILTYRKHLKQEFQKENFHLYPDIITAINKKSFKSNASFEGNTNLDLKIIGKVNNTGKHLYIEAKFLSDISYKIKYNPVRDQIIRNIDTGIEFVKENGIDLKDFYFFLLTPKVFRCADFGEVKQSALNQFNSQYSRLYSYKMVEYRKPANLKAALPHRNDLSDSDWDTIARNIGWMTFEDFYRSAIKFSTIENDDEKNMINDFFIERNLNETERSD